MEISIGETNIRLKTDIANHGLVEYISSVRAELNSYITRNPEFLHSFTPVNNDGEEVPAIVSMMIESSKKSDVGPMACVAGTISEMSLNHLIGMGSGCSIVENGGDIALINNRSILCGIYSGNEILGDNIAFRIKARRSPLGICTSSATMGHSISFGSAESVTVISKSASISDGLATRIANEAKGTTDEDKAERAAETAERYRELFSGVLIICSNNVATVGRLPRIVETDKFDVNQI